MIELHFASIFINVKLSTVNLLSLRLVKVKSVISPFMIKKDPFSSELLIISVESIFMSSISIFPVIFPYKLNN